MIAPDQRNIRVRKESPSLVRTEAQLDRDRILYCPHFSRLADVTQVRTLDSDQLVHNRLTHSLKVGQIARRITEKFLQDENSDQRALANEWQLDPDVSEAAGLAHDLGHPPFGHIAEDELNLLVSNSDPLVEGYEGNAQSFRIVTRLGVSDTWPIEDPESTNALGLNLTKATLNAILKYPWLHLENDKKKNKWGAYASEKEIFDRTRENLVPLYRTPEAEIMDWADDVTYAVHDLIDFFFAGLIPLHLLAGPKPVDSATSHFFSRAKKRNPKLDNSQYADALGSIKGMFPDQAHDGSHAHTKLVWQSATRLITLLVGAIKLRRPDQNEGRYTKVNAEAAHLVDILQEMTWVYVIENPELAIVQHGQRRIIRKVFETLLEEASAKKWNLFPHGFYEFISAQPDTSRLERHVADFISGLTERQLIRFHRKITGEG